MDVFDVERRVKRLISAYMQEGGTDSQVISRLHLSLSVDEKDTLLEGVYRRYLSELRQHDRLQATTTEILQPKSNPKVTDVSGQRDDMLVRREIKYALADLANSRFNSLEEHAVALQRMCRQPFFAEGVGNFVLGDADFDLLEKSKQYYIGKQKELQPRVEVLERMQEFMGRVKVGGTFRQAIDYVNEHGSEIDNAIVTDMLAAAEELS